MAPERTCVACREHGDREVLLRIALAPDGSLVVDLRARLPGRGAWLHARRSCVERAEARPEGLRRTLKSQVRTEGLGVAIREAVIRSALDGLSMAAAAGALVGGHDLLEDALANGRISEVVVAVDASERTIADLRKAAGESVAFVRLPLDREALGARVGRGPRAALGVGASRATHHLRMQLRRLLDLG